MNSTRWLLRLRMDCEEALAYAQRQLTEHHVKVVRSFDLKSARATCPEIVCPNHGDAPCDCQLVVLLAYGSSGSPASLVVYSHHGQTEIEITNPLDHVPQPELLETIITALESGARNVFPSCTQVDVSTEK